MLKRRGGRYRPGQRSSSWRKIKTRARTHAKLVTSGRHTIIEGAHPSPMSVKEFRGSRPYSRINAALRAHGLTAATLALVSMLIAMLLAVVSLTADPKQAQAAPASNEWL